MERTNKVDGSCPVCGYGMVISRLSCSNCGSALVGSFALAKRPTPGGDRSGEARFGRLARLDSTQLEFVEVFLRCRGLINNVEDMLGISYRPVKRRLANVRDSMGADAEKD